MIKAKIVHADNELLAFINALGGLDVVKEIVQNASGHWTILYEDDADPEQVIIRGESGLFGFSYGAKDNIDSTAVAANQLVRLSSFFTSVAAEAIDAGGNQAVDGTLAHTYVMPGSVVFEDAGGNAPNVVDNEEGLLVSVDNRLLSMGTINYSTGVYSIRYPQNKIPSGAVTADYDYSSLPDSSEFPRACEITRVVVKMIGGSATTIDWELYEDSAAALPPVASGTALALTNGQTKYIDINQVTHTKDLVDRDARWLRIDPNSNSDSDYIVYAYWRRHSTT